MPRRLLEPRQVRLHDRHVHVLQRVLRLQLRQPLACRVMTKQTIHHTPRRRRALLHCIQYLAALHIVRFHKVCRVICIYFAPVRVMWRRLYRQQEQANRPSSRDALIASLSASKRSLLFLCLSSIHWFRSLFSKLRSVREARNGVLLERSGLSARPANSNNERKS